MPICGMALGKDDLTLDAVLWTDAGDCVQPRVQGIRESVVAKSPITQRALRGAFEDLQSSGFWADYGQPAPYPSLTVRARNVRVGDKSPGTISSLLSHGTTVS
jgi:hypothetical protein